MTDKPQTLAEQALKLARLQERMDAIGNQKQNHKPIIDCLRDCAAALADAAATTPAEHFDDHAVRQFAKMMAAKMAASRAKGRSGWDDPNQCSVEHLQALLHEHVAKGDPVDVANICMMLRHYEASTATTTPVVVAEQAGDVRQAVPEWGTSDKTQHYAAMVADTNDADILRAAISDLCRDNERLAVMLKSAKQPDPAPALGWRAMQTAAAEVAISFDRTREYTDEELGLLKGRTLVKPVYVANAILAIPGPTDAQLLAEALRLREVQAVVKCLDREKSLIWIIENTVQVLIRNLALEMLGQQRAALKAWNDSQRPPSEYEQKLAAMKKDFPNGI